MTIRLQPVEFDWMSDDDEDEDDELLLPDGADDTFEDSPDEYFVVDGPAAVGDDFESFVLAVEVLEELLGGKSLDWNRQAVPTTHLNPKLLMFQM